MEKIYKNENLNYTEQCKQCDEIYNSVTYNDINFLKCDTPKEYIKSDVIKIEIIKCLGHHYWWRNLIGMQFNAVLKIYPNGNVYSDYTPILDFKIKDSSSKLNKYIFPKNIIIKAYHNVINVDDCKIIL